MNADAEAEHVARCQAKQERVTDLPGGAGHAIICSPEEILAESRRPGVLTATVDLDRIQWLRDTMDHYEENWPWRAKPGIFKQWRRPGLYGGIGRSGV